MSPTPRADRVRAPRAPHLRMPPETVEELLENRGPLTPGLDRDGFRFLGTDLGGQDGSGARFLDCALLECRLDETRLGRARFLDSLLRSPAGVGTDLSGTTWRDVRIEEPRLGGVQWYDSVWERVHVRGGKLDFTNLRGARLTDVVFESCVLVEADFGGATLERVSFEGCVLREADFTGARLTEVDLRGTGELGLGGGLGSLAGAVVSPTQLLDLAPALAAHLGLRVLP